MNFSHVLISRPEAESRRLADRVRTTGLEPVVMPAFAFRSTGRRVKMGADWHHAEARLAVFTSPRAVQFGTQQIPDGLLRGTRIAALGPATAAALEAAGFKSHLVPESLFTTEALLALRDFPSGPGEAVIFAAPGGRQALRIGLEERGWKVTMAMVYERVALEPDPDQVAVIRSATGMLSVWTSAAAMERLLERLPGNAAARVKEGVFIVASERLARLAERLGASGTHVASGANNASLIEAIGHLAG